MAKSEDSAKTPSDVGRGHSLFDRFATCTSERVSKAWFFDPTESAALSAQLRTQIGSP